MNVNAQNRSKPRKDEVFRSPFRYVIVSDKFDPKIGEGDDDRRFIEILMDKKSFSKKNLITLFQLVAKRYPKPALLYIDVFTNLDDIETPEESEQPKLSGTRGAKMPTNNAIFTRANNKMFFYIYFGNGDFEEVEMK